MDYQAIIIAVGTVIGAAVLTAVLTKNSMTQWWKWTRLRATHCYHWTRCAATLHRLRVYHVGDHLWPFTTHAYEWAPATLSLCGCRWRIANVVLLPDDHPFGDAWKRSKYIPVQLPYVMAVEGGQIRLPRRSKCRVYGSQFAQAVVDERERLRITDKPPLYEKLS